MSDISIVRGDDRQLAVTVTNAAGAAVNLTGATGLTFTVKRSRSDATAVLAKTLGAGVTVTSPATAGIAAIDLTDTDTLALSGTYVWDLELTISGTTTTVAQGRLLVTADVTGPGAYQGALLTVDELTDHIETSLSTTSLQALLSAAEEAINAAVGASATAVEIHNGGFRKIALHRPAASITSIVERRSSTNTTLAADDYRLRAEGYVLERLSDGTNSRSTWNELVTVTYVPIQDIATRRMVQLELVKLAISSDPALSSRTIGSWSETYRTDLSHEQRRAEILAMLSPAPYLMVVN